MKTAVRLLLVALCSQVPLLAELKVEALSAAWERTRRSGEAEAIRAGLADGFMVVFPDGSTGDAAAFVAAIVDKSEPALAMGAAELSVSRVYDAAAILHGVYVFGDSVTETEWVDERRKVAGRTQVVKVEKTVTRTLEARVRFTEFWVSEKGEARLAMIQLTPVTVETPLRR